MFRLAFIQSKQITTNIVFEKIKLQYKKYDLVLTTMFIARNMFSELNYLEV